MDLGIQACSPIRVLVEAFPQTGQHQSATGGMYDSRYNPPNRSCSTSHRYSSAKSAYDCPAPTKKTMMVDLMNHLELTTGSKHQNGVDSEEERRHTRVEQVHAFRHSRDVLVFVQLEHRSADLQKCWMRKYHLIVFTRPQVSSVLPATRDWTYEIATRNSRT